jgi:predicted aspartyl protease
MSFPFNPSQGLVIVRAELEGPTGNGVLRLALDTGATGTVVSAAMLVAVGYDPALAPVRLQVTTGSGIEFAPRITLMSRIISLGQERTIFPVLCHTLPPSAGVDGLLGHDFLRGQVLTLDFVSGLITLS